MCIPPFSEISEKRSLETNTRTRARLHRLIWHHYAREIPIYLKSYREPHRAKLTALERDEQVTKWIELSAERISSQVETKIERGRPEGGVSAAARDLNISKPDAHRAIKVAGLSNEAKEAARETGEGLSKSGDTPLPGQLTKILRFAGCPIWAAIRLKDF